MKIMHIVLAVIITLGMLYIARTNSEGRPEEYTHDENYFSFHMTSIPKIIEGQADTIKVTVKGPMAGRRLMLRTTQGVPEKRLDLNNFGVYSARLMHSYLDAPDVYLIPTRAEAKGGRYYYYFEVRDLTNKVLATFTRPDGSPFMTKYIGEVPPIVLIGHILFIFATVFFISLATLHGFRVLASGEGLRPMAFYLFLGTVSCLIGCYPLGIPMNWYAFGATWEGVPFGTDATDNKTQLLFVFMLFAMLSTLGTLTRGRFGRDLFGTKTLGVIGVGTFAVMLFIYLIPHSIQFDPIFTYGFCYTWIGIIAALYLLGLLKSRRKA